MQQTSQRPPFLPASKQDARHDAVDSAGRLPHGRSHKTQCFITHATRNDKEPLTWDLNGMPRSSFASRPA